MRSQKVISFVEKILEDKLPSGLVYHLVDHTFDVVDSAIRLAKLEGLSESDQELVMVAAAFHDIGYTVRYKYNEELAVEFVKEHLPKFGYNNEEITTVENAILATRIPQTPKNIISEIVCDADLDYLGREDFYIISQKLRNEWINFGLIGEGDKEWNLIQYDFLSSHAYFTDSAMKMRNELKSKHLEEIKKLI